ncbi:MAG: DUF6049 family protein [Actinomycetota bacterium]|nr:DUF6049 family protein [Actinomycetota bacterium]
MRRGASGILELRAAACAALLLCLLPAGGMPAAAQEQAPAVSARMQAFYYQPGEQAYLDLHLTLPEAERTGSLYLELLIYPSATTRSSLSAFREGTRRRPLVWRDLETIEPGEGWTDKMYELDLKSLGLPAGVYPFEVRATAGGETVASDSNFLVIMDPAAGYPLNLSLLWILDFLPPTDAQGNALDGALAAACASSDTDTGYLYALTRALKRFTAVSTSLAIPGSTYEDLEQLAGSETAGQSPSSGAAVVLADLAYLSGENRVDFLTTPYSFADPDLLAARGWEEEASRQLRLGAEGSGALGAAAKGFVSPLFRLSDSTLGRLAEGGMEFAVVGAEALRYSATGRRLLEGATLSQPVRFVNSEGLLFKAFVCDEALYAYLEGMPSGDSSHLVQNIFAELAVLQRERPNAVRSCVLAFPPSFSPSRDFIDAFYGAVNACPWLQTRRLSELNADQFPLEGVAVQAPVYEDPGSPYLDELEAVRSAAADFLAVIPAEHPLGTRLERSLLVAENHRFVRDGDNAASRTYLSSIEAVVKGELSRVSISKKRSVTLSSTQGKLSIDVNSSLDYPLSGVTLRLDNPALSFPGGDSMVVTIEPRENRFTFDVNTHRKGSFIVDIVLEAGGLVIDGTSTTVNTSIINTLAVIMLAAVAGLVVVALLSRRLLRGLRGGRHARGKASG